MDARLTDDQQSILDQILAGPLAWTSLLALVKVPLRAEYVAGLVAELIALDLVEVWESRLALTLTPLGAARLGVAIREEWVYGSMVEDQFAGVSWDEEGQPVVKVRRVRLRIADEAPRWSPDTEPVRPLRSPRYAREQPIVFPELVPSPAPNPVPAPPTRRQRLLWGYLVPISA